MIKEWNLLRAIACLSIVFLHSTTQTGRIVGYPQLEFFQLFRVFLTYATPTFIVLSVIILANRYPEKLPDKFWSTRFKWILVPYLVFAVIDAFVSKHFNANIILDLKIYDNIFTGKFVGWFILVIFQFYLLHYLVTRFKISMTWFLPFSILIMAIYQNIVGGSAPFIKEHSILWKLPFIGWFGYFTIGFILGKHYKIVAARLLQYRWYTLLGILASLLIIYISYQSGDTSVNSRRLDLFPLVVSVTAAIIAWGQLIPNFKIINLISNFSFGIYLLHWQVQRFMAPYTAELFNRNSLRILALFLVSLIISLVIIKLLSLLPFGSYIVGKVKKRKPKSNSIPTKKLA